MNRVTSPGLLILVVAVAAAQNYRCDWSVNGIAGGSMSSATYRSDATAGQTAAGTITGSAYQAFIGFWQIDAATGIREQAQPPSVAPLVTRLYAPQPNPSRGSVVIHYTLDAERPVLLQVHDLTGRVVATLASRVQEPGRHGVSWNGKDARGRSLAEGVYFFNLTAGGYQATEKVLLTK
jgi:hypothetical protein